ncbi:DUF2975 domain-containing protein [Gramella sp. MT6]|nr:DUF2975 domain-containing protein [Gramella sp. MT6]
MLNDNLLTMNKNLLLNIANSICYFLKALIALGLILITLFLIHIQFNRSAYENWDFEFKQDRLAISSNSDKNLEYSLGRNSSFITYHLDSNIKMKDFKPVGKSLSNWKNGSLYFSYLKYMLVFLLFYLIIHQFGEIIRSVKKLSTFHQTNVIAFKKIGKYCLLIFLLSIFNYWKIGDFSRASISIYLTPLLFALFAFILSEIFKEGNNLKNENELTV